MVLRLVLLSTLSCGFSLPKFEISEECRDAHHECVLTSECPSALDMIDNKKMHHGYQRCGWYGREEAICCPSNDPFFTRGLPFKSAAACQNFIKTRPGILDQQILGGTKVEPGEFPHMAALGFTRDGRVSWGSCGGSLISYDYVLTAAHCTSQTTDGVTVDVSMVRLGVVNLTHNSDAFDVSVTEILINQNYSQENKHNDIALLRLETPIHITPYLSPVCLYQNTTDPDMNITIVGWGSIVKEPSVNTSDALQKAVVTPFDIESCNDKYNSGPFVYEIIASQMCAVSLKGTIGDTCKGDSGGPAQVIIEDAIFVVGVTSYGTCSVKPGVYTRVASYIKWIENNVWP